MKRVNQYDFYNIGSAVHPLTDVKAGTTVGDIFLPLVVSQHHLGSLLNGTMIPVRVARQACLDLRDRINELVSSGGERGPEFDKELKPYEAYQLSDAAKRFETVMSAELQTIDTYFIEQKGAFSTPDLIERAEIVLPEAVRKKLPDGAIRDLREAGRALALDLPTAAGFHMLRAAEAVILRYYRAIVKKEPSTRSWGHYVEALKRCGAPEKVVSTINQIRDLHRNPLMHPEDVLSEDGALVLFGIVQSAIISVVVDLADRAGDVPEALATLTGTAPVAAIAAPEGADEDETGA